MERFMMVKLIEAITIYADWIFWDSFYLTVCKVILLIREYCAGQLGRSDRLKNIGGLRRNLY